MGYPRVTIGHLRVTVGHLRVTMGPLRLTIGYLKATIVHIRVTLVIFCFQISFSYKYLIALILMSSKSSLLGNFLFPAAED